MDETMTDTTAAAGDLRWYFAREGTGPLKSNYMAMVHRIAMGRAQRDRSAGADDGERLEAAARSGSVARVLRALDPATAEVLRHAFDGDWPKELAALGELSGLVPLTPAAIEAHRLSRTKLSFGEWLRHLARRRTPESEATLDEITAQATILRTEAVANYLNARRRVGLHG